jgi:hypothetical protein
MQHNMRIKILIFLSLFILNLSSDAQVVDSLSQQFKYKHSFIPMSLIVGGIFLNRTNFEQDFQNHLRSQLPENYEFRVDNYMQYLPIAELYLADVAGIKAKHYWFDQTKYLFISNLISSSITHALKHLVMKTRPNGAAFAFPSGHTTFAFTNASVLFQEFRNQAPVLAYSGYAFAAATGSFRMINNKHWLSDVVMGAGIGILVTELVYQWEPLKNFNPFRKSENISFIPTLENANYGFYFSYKF